MAEFIINLIHNDGALDSLLLLKGGTIEAAYAQLEVATMLLSVNKNFHLRNANGVLGKSYDLEISHASGRTICGEIKCKLEFSDFQKTSFKKSLEKARSKNLPADMPGAVFIKIPFNWWLDNTLADELLNILDEFLRQSSRIVSVVVYCISPFFEQGGLVEKLTLVEFPNLNNKFDRNVDWRIFENNSYLGRNPFGWINLGNTYGNISESGLHEPS